MSLDEEYSSSVEPEVEPQFLNLRGMGVTTIEHLKELTTESAAMNLPPLELSPSLSSDENESEDNVDPEQEITDEDSQWSTINSDECPDEQRGYEWSDEENFAGL